ncbi:MAG: DUF4197 domain-containing protein [Fibromonadaceae bacterium]|jgi:hypothetical protein|nr:DUF4197 domain-containing protein [Fibromonadaceae bacterium]
MRKYIFIAFFSLALSLGLLSCGIHGLLSDELSESKIVEALQEALFLGSKTAAENLSTPCANMGNCTSGYLGNKQKIDLVGTTLEILLPDTIKHVLDTIDYFTDKFNALPSSILSAINTAMNLSGHLSKPSATAGPAQSASLNFSNLSGLGSRIKDTLNMGAERAAPKSVDLFRDAIFEMSFSNARSILFGNDSIAATSYLRDKTKTELQGVFGGILESCLNELHLNEFWGPVASNYNSFANAYKSAIISSGVTSTLNVYNSSLPESRKVKLPGLPYDNLGADLSGDLSKYATGRALDGLFYMVGVQESKLRADPWGTVRAVGGFITDAVGDLLGSVFSKAKEG